MGPRVTSTLGVPPAVVFSVAGDPALSNKRFRGPSSVAGLSPQSARSAAMRILQPLGREHGGPGHKHIACRRRKLKNGPAAERIRTRCGLPVHTTTRTVANALA